MSNELFPFYASSAAQNYASFEFLSCLKELVIALKVCNVLDLVSWSISFIMHYLWFSNSLSYYWCSPFAHFFFFLLISPKSSLPAPVDWVPSPCCIVVIMDCPMTAFLVWKLTLESNEFHFIRFYFSETFQVNFSRKILLKCKITEFLRISKKILILHSHLNAG